MRTKALLATAIAALFLAAGLASAAQRKAALPRGLQKAVFAGGCFWCMEEPFDVMPGVRSTTVGYTGGTVKKPNYEEVSSGKTGHCEAVEVSYDPSKVAYQQLLDVFWRNIDPTTKDKQFSDVGPQYRTAVFYHTEEQRKLALESKERMDKSGRFGKPIVTQIVPATAFWPAEDYHQNFYEKSTIRYRFYRQGSGRDQYLRRIWGAEAGH